jgi:hypothetical protein
MDKEIDDLIKKITVSIIQFDTDTKQGNFEGIKTFLNEIEPLYKNFLHEYRYEDSEFKKEIHEVIRYLFTEERIFHHAFASVENTNGSVTFTEENSLLSKQIYEVKRTIIPPDPYTPAGGVEFRDTLQWEFTDPLSEFVLKYNGRYDNSESKKKYSDKYYAWYHKILIAKGKAERFTPGAKQEIIDYGKNEYGTKGSGFYQAFMEFDLTSRQSFVNSFSPKERKKWKEIIIEISNRDTDVINYLKEFP